VRGTFISAPCTGTLNETNHHVLEHEVIATLSI
jgi:hypothetical protein